MMRRLLGVVSVAVFLASTPAAQEGQTTADRAKERHLAGHSRFGEAFDEGPRERPRR